MKLSDYVLKYLADQGTKHVFLITGGAVMNLVDSFRKVDGLDYICVQNEQAAAMAAEAYTRISGKLGSAMATSGPGATNLITGICCAYFDSIPAIYITGQVNTFESKGDRAVRQVGFQETDIVNIVKPVTKFATLVKDPQKIKYYLDKAYYLAQSGRPGPVLLDIPMNVQRAEINPDELESFRPEEPKKNLENIANQISIILDLIKNAQRPIILAGAGVRHAGAVQEFKEFVEKLQIPFTLSWGAMDLMAYHHPLFVGSFGVTASRSGNFAVQNSDLLIIVGSRLDTRQTGGRPETFARGAKKVYVDIDKAEIFKKRGLDPDIAVVNDVKDFLTLINQKLDRFSKPDFRDWIHKTQNWKEKYPIYKPEYAEAKDKVNIYHFMKVLSEESANNDIIITDAGGNLTWTMQGFQVKEGQRLFSAFGHSPMGYSLAAAIGASLAANKKPVTCIIGDGGIQINIQELQTVAHYKLPIKIFIINNNCYGIIKQFQDTWLDSQYEATCPEKGCSFPNFVKVGQAYGLKTETIASHSELRDKIKNVLAANEPILCDVKIPSNQRIEPRVVFGNPLEDAAPLLDRQEFLENMIVKPWEPG